MQRRRASALLVVAALLVGACSSSTSDGGPTVDVFGVYRGEEATQFAATIARFETATGIDVRYVGAGSFAVEIQDRVADANYPDIAIFPQPALIRDFAERGLLVPLPPDITQAMVASIPSMPGWSLDGTEYGVWFRASVKSLVWYPPDVFAERGYEVPQSWEELMALTREIAADGTAPWCLAMESFGSTGWVGTDWIEDIVLRFAGSYFYDAWVDGTLAFTDEVIVAAFETFAEIVDEPDLVLGGAQRILNTRWQDAADPMFADVPECLLHRQASFHKASLPDGVEIGEDVDVFALPAPGGGTPPVVVAGDVAAAFNDRPEVMEFLAYLGTAEAGEPWAELGGFTSPHSDFDVAAYADEFDRRMGEMIAEAPVVRFDGSDEMDPAVGSGTFWSGMRTFVRTANIQLAVEEIQAGYGQPAASETDESS